MFSNKCSDFDFDFIVVLSTKPLERSEDVAARDECGRQSINVRVDRSVIFASYVKHFSSIQKYHLPWAPHLMRLTSLQ